jgi:flagellar motor switch protein FliN
MSNPEDTDLTVEEEDPWAEAMDEQSAEEESAEEEPVEEEAAEEEDPWAEAMEEQSAEEESTEEEAAEEEPVADVIPEQANESATDKTTANVAEEKSPVVPTPKPTPQPTPQPTQAPNAKPAGDEVFKPLNTDVSQTAPRELEMIMDIPVKLYVELGRTRITIKQLLELTQGSVVELEGLAGDPMDILINGHLIAQGEIVVVDEKYGIRVTEIITPSERAQKLNQ